MIDLAASSLALAGIDIPAYMHGKDVIGGAERDFIFGFRQRCGDAVDNIRSISDGSFKLIWNREPERPYMQLSSYKKLQYPAHTVYNVLHKNGELKEPHSRFMAESRSDFELYDLRNDPYEFNNLSGNVDYKQIQEKLFNALSETLSEVEKNMIIESTEAIQKARQGSVAYFSKGMDKKGLSAESSDEEILEHWERQLLDQE